MIHILYGLNFVYGLILNSLIILVCFRKRLRQMATFIILAFLALSNTLALFGYPLHSFVENILSVDLKQSNAAWCKFVVTTTAFTFEWTIWLLALASIEMYLTLRIENLRLRFSNCRNTIIVCILLGLISIAFNFPERVLKAFDLMAAKNRTAHNNVCTDTRLDDELILFYTKAHRFSLVILPIILVAIFNGLLVYEIKKSKKAAETQSIIKDDLKNMAKTLIIISTMFVAVLIPRCVVTLVYSVCCASDKDNEWIFALIECIDFLYSICLNSIFFILITRNELFSDEFKNFYMRQHSSDLTHI